MFSAFVLMVPMIYLSGLIFPIENMPRALPARQLRHPGALLRQHHPRRSSCAARASTSCGPTPWPCSAEGVLVLTLAATAGPQEPGLRRVGLAEPR